MKQKTIFMQCFCAVIFLLGGILLLEGCADAKTKVQEGTPFFQQKGRKIEFTYQLLKQEDTSLAKRVRATIRLQGARSLTKANDDALKKVTKILRKQLTKRAKAITVWIHFPPRHEGLADITICYAKDKKGFSGNDDWEWKIERHFEELDAIEDTKKRTEFMTGINRKLANSDILKSGILKLDELENKRITVWYFFNNYPEQLSTAENYAYFINKQIIELLMESGRKPSKEMINISVRAAKREKGVSGSGQIRIWGRARYNYFNDSIEWIPASR